MTPDNTFEKLEDDILNLKMSLKKACSLRDCVRKCWKKSKKKLKNKTAAEKSSMGEELMFRNISLNSDDEIPNLTMRFARASYLHDHMKKYTKQLEKRLRKKISDLKNVKSSLTTSAAVQQEVSSVDFSHYNQEKGYESPHKNRGPGHHPLEVSNSKLHERDSLNKVNNSISTTSSKTSESSHIPYDITPQLPKNIKFRRKSEKEDRKGDPNKKISHNINTEDRNNNDVIGEKTETSPKPFQWSVSPSHEDREITRRKRVSHVSRRDDWQRKKRKTEEVYSPPLTRSRSRSQSATQRAGSKSNRGKSKSVSPGSPVACRTRSRSRSKSVDVQRTINVKIRNWQHLNSRTPKPSERSNEKSKSQGGKRSRSRSRSVSAESIASRTRSKSRSKSIGSKDENVVKSRGRQGSRPPALRDISPSRPEDEILVRRSERSKSRPKPARSQSVKKTEKPRPKESRKNRERSKSATKVNKTKVSVKSKRRHSQTSSKSPIQEGSSEGSKSRSRRDRSRSSSTSNSIASQPKDVRTSPSGMGDAGNRVRSFSDASNSSVVSMKIIEDRETQVIQCSPTKRSDRHSGSSTGSSDKRSRDKSQSRSMTEHLEIGRDERKRNDEHKSSKEKSRESKENKHRSRRSSSKKHSSKRKHEDKTELRKRRSRSRSEKVLEDERNRLFQEKFLEIFGSTSGDEEEVEKVVNDVDAEKMKEKLLERELDPLLSEKSDIAQKSFDFININKCSAFSPMKNIGNIVENKENIKNMNNRKSETVSCSPSNDMKTSLIKIKIRLPETNDVNVSLGTSSEDCAKEKERKNSNAESDIGYSSSSPDIPEEGSTIMEEILQDPAITNECMNILRNPVMLSGKTDDTDSDIEFLEEESDIAIVRSSNEQILGEVESEQDKDKNKNKEKGANAEQTESETSEESRQSLSTVTLDESTVASENDAQVEESDALEKSQVEHSSNTDLSSPESRHEKGTTASETTSDSILDLSSQKGRSDKESDETTHSDVLDLSRSKTVTTLRSPNYEDISDAEDESNKQQQPRSVHESTPSFDADDEASGDSSNRPEVEIRGEVIADVGERDNEEDRETVIFESSLTDPVSDHDIPDAEEVKKILEKMKPGMIDLFDQSNFIATCQEMVARLPNLAEGLNREISEKRKILRENCATYQSSILNGRDELLKYYTQNSEEVHRIISDEFNIPTEKIEMIINLCLSIEGSKSSDLDTSPTEDSQAGTPEETAASTEGMQEQPMIVQSPVHNEEQSINPRNSQKVTPERTEGTQEQSVIQSQVQIPHLSEVSLSNQNQSINPGYSPNATPALSSQEVPIQNAQTFSSQSGVELRNPQPQPQPQPQFQPQSQPQPGSYQGLYQMHAQAPTNNEALPTYPHSQYPQGSLNEAQPGKKERAKKPRQPRKPRGNAKAQKSQDTGLKSVDSIRQQIDPSYMSGNSSSPNSSSQSRRSSTEIQSMEDMCQRFPESHHQLWACQSPRRLSNEERMPSPQSQNRNMFFPNQMPGVPVNQVPSSSSQTQIPLQNVPSQSRYVQSALIQNSPTQTFQQLVTYQISQPSTQPMPPNTPGMSYRSFPVPGQPPSSVNFPPGATNYPRQSSYVPSHLASQNNQSQQENQYQYQHQQSRMDTEVLQASLQLLRELQARAGMQLVPQQIGPTHPNQIHCPMPPGNVNYPTHPSYVPYSQTQTGNPLLQLQPRQTVHATQTSCTSSPGTNRITVHQSCSQSQSGQFHLEQQRNEHQPQRPTENPFLPVLEEAKGKLTEQLASEMAEIECLKENLHKAPPHQVVFLQRDLLRYLQEHLQTVNKLLNVHEQLKPYSRSQQEHQDLQEHKAKIVGQTVHLQKLISQHLQQQQLQQQQQQQQQPQTQQQQGQQQPQARQQQQQQSQVQHPQSQMQQQQQQQPQVQHPQPQMQQQQQLLLLQQQQQQKQQQVQPQLQQQQQQQPQPQPQLPHIQPVRSHQRIKYSPRRKSVTPSIPSPSPSLSPGPGTEAVAETVANTTATAAPTSMLLNFTSPATSLENVGIVTVPVITTATTPTATAVATGATTTFTTTEVERETVDKEGEPALEAEESFAEAGQSVAEDESVFGYSTTEEIDEEDQGPGLIICEESTQDSDSDLEIIEEKITRFGTVEGPQTQFKSEKVDADDEPFRKRRKRECAVDDCLGEGIIFCEKCRTRVYCSEKCKKEDWEDHRDTCRLLSTLKSANSC